ncbi:MAG: replicative DNA helicase, partial [Actinomyces sp.]
MNERTERIPPHNLEAEESLLGAMLLSRDAIADALEIVTAEQFYRPAHAHIFEAISALYAEGDAVDPVTVAEVLDRSGVLEQVGGLDALLSLQVNTPATSNAA